MYDTYIVKDGDTIEDIALKYNTSPKVLFLLNDNLTGVKVGDKLIVPKVTSDFFDYYTVVSGDSLYKIANDNNIDSLLLAQLNGINQSDYIYPNQVLLIPKPGSILYFTAIGDTLSEIAKGIGAPIQELIDQNQKIYLQPEQLIVYKYRIKA